MDPAEEVIELRLKLAKAERELAEARTAFELARGTARVASSVRDEQSAEINRLRRAVTGATVVLAPLRLLLAQLEANPADKTAWQEAHALPAKVDKALRGEREDFHDAADTTPDLTPLEPSRTPTRPGLPALARPATLPPKK